MDKAIWIGFGIVSLIVIIRKISRMQTDLWKANHFLYANAKQIHDRAPAKYLAVMDELKKRGVANPFLAAAEILSILSITQNDEQTLVSWVPLFINPAGELIRREAKFCGLKLEIPQ